MANKTMWMVRSASGGRLADEFKDKNVVAIGWWAIGDLAQYKDKDSILEAIRHHSPDWSNGKVMSSASQLQRFKEKLLVSGSDLRNLLISRILMSK